MAKIYGYARVSTAKQILQRQIDNIKQFNDKAIIFTEKYTGTKISGRQELEKLLKKVKKGDTIIFDSVSRMSRNAQEGIDLYFNLYDKGINLIFLKERYIDTQAYKDAIEKSGISVDIENNTAEGELVTDIIKAINKFMRVKVADDILKAFEQAEKEVVDLRERIKEGIAKSPKTQGIDEGTKLITKKSIEMKEKMHRQIKEFGGTETDIQFISDNNISRNTFYKYKKELLADAQ